MSRRAPAAVLVLVVALVLASCGAGPAGSDPAAPGSTGPPPTYAGLPYAHTSPSQNLDLWLPPAATAAVPVVVYVHGGAYSGGDEESVGPKVQALVDAGYAVASIDYRLTAEARFPAGVQDAKAAVRWLRANAATYGLDPDRVAAWGESAGGHIVALLGTTGDQVTIFDDPDLGNADVSGAVQAVIDWYGPSNFALMDPESARNRPCPDPKVHDAPTSSESYWLGSPLPRAPDRVAQADPTTYLAAATDLPPFSIAHGDADCIVPFEQSQYLADALRHSGATVDLTILDGAGHGDARFAETRTDPTIAWLDRVL